MISKLKTLQLIKFAGDYASQLSLIKHRTIDGNDNCFFANNAQIAPYLKKDFTFESFKKLFELCSKNGVFDLHFYKSIPYVTLHSAAKHMTRKWPRDHCGMIPLIEKKYPHKLWSGLCQWAKAYNQPTEIRAFERVFKNPTTARNNSGIAHTFWQKDDGSLVRDSKWKMHQRIESHGELLRYMAKYTRSQLSTNNDLPEDIVQTLVRLAHYLYIQGLSPQSCGPWEEIPFQCGINWDNLSVAKAFEEVINLTTELNKYPVILQHFIKFEDDLCRQFNLTPLFSSKQPLQKFICSSLIQIRHFYLDEFHGHTKRIDSSSVILAAEAIDLSASQNPLVNIRKHLKILKRFEKKLVHEFGAWRYNQFSTYVDGKSIKSCDSYLNLNYYILCDKKGHLCKDKPDLDDSKKSKPNDNGVSHFTQRALRASEKTTAQWGLPLSYAAIAYGKLTSLLLDIKNNASEWTKDEEKLLNLCFNKNQEFIKRTYATISGEYPDGKPFLKADGKPIKPFLKPEAYQAITSELNSSKFAFIPGVNDHLGWDAAKCYEASELFLQNLQRMNSSTHGDRDDRKV